MNSTLEALTAPSIAFSGFVGTIIIGIISAQAKIKKNPLRFFIPLEEFEFMSSPIKLFRFTYISILVLGFSSAYSLLVTSAPFDLQEFSIYGSLNFLFSNIYTIIIGILFLIIMQTLSFKIIQRKITTFMYSKKRKSKRRRDFILLSIIFSLLYLIFFSLVYGWLCNILLIEQATMLKKSYTNSLEILLSFKYFQKSVSIFLIILTAIYWLIVFRVRNLYLYLGHSKIRTNIILNNGLKFENKRIIHFDIENSYLVSDFESDYEPKKYLIPKVNIEYISFSNIYCSLGRDISINSSSIVTIKDFDSKEMSLLKSIKSKSTLI
ncbi:hypothetical protein [Paenibacillus xylanexedens]|uniref:hypothetical protein n=1 Tax=Paenibacillus xylanexedens TaxID=528191 RepID=UPI001C8E666E|nr:hypothetical protein [Paenibacillus xylanexedens]MBY0117728.1 hypothetical protein [Paenibacillus xylanexedens]